MGRCVDRPSDGYMDGSTNQPSPISLSTVHSLYLGVRFAGDRDQIRYPREQVRPLPALLDLGRDLAVEVPLGRYADRSSLRFPRRQLPSLELQVVPDTDSDSDSGGIDSGSGRRWVRDLSLTCGFDSVGLKIAFCCPRIQASRSICELIRPSSRLGSGSASDRVIGLGLVMAVGVPEPISLKSFSSPVSNSI